MTSMRERFTSGREVTIYLIAHALGLLCNIFVTNPVLETLIRNGHRDILLPLGIAIQVGLTLVVMLIFLMGRRMVGGMQVPHAALPLATPGQATPALAALPGQAVSSSGTTLGIVSIVCGALGLMPTAGILFAVVGLVTGLMGRGRAQRAGNERGALLSLIGTILSAVTVVIAVVVLFVVGGLLVGMSR